MNILLLGGTGFLGKNIALELSKNNNITVVGQGHSFNNMIDTYDYLLNDLPKIISLIEKKKIEIIIHLVSTLIPSSNEEKYLNDILNVYIPTVKLLEYCSEKKIKFVYISSGGSVYGNSNEELNELCIQNPISYYGLSKQNFENLILFFHNTKKLDYLILRPSNIYGYGQNLYGNQGLISVIFGKIFKKEPIEIWGDGTVCKDYLYIDDFVYYVTFLFTSKKSWNEIYNIGSGIGVSVNEVVNTFLTNKISLPTIKYIESTDFDVKHLILDCTKLKNICKHNCISLNDGIMLFYKKICENKFD